MENLQRGFFYKLEVPAFANDIEFPFFCGKDKVSFCYLKCALSFKDKTHLQPGKFAWKTLKYWKIVLQNARGIKYFLAAEIDCIAKLLKIVGIWRQKPHLHSSPWGYLVVSQLLLHILLVDLHMATSELTDVIMVLQLKKPLFCLYHLNYIFLMERIFLKRRRIFMKFSTHWQLRKLSKCTIMETTKNQQAFEEHFPKWHLYITYCTLSNFLAYSC